MHVMIAGYLILSHPVEVLLTKLLKHGHTEADEEEVCVEETPNHLTQVIDHLAPVTTLVPVRGQDQSRSMVGKEKKS